MASCISLHAILLHHVDTTMISLDCFVAQRHGVKVLVPNNAQQRVGIFL